MPCFELKAQNSYGLPPVLRGRQFSCERLPGSLLYKCSTRTIDSLYRSRDRVIVLQGRDKNGFDYWYLLAEITREFSKGRKFPYSEVAKEVESRLGRIPGWLIFMHAARSSSGRGSRALHLHAICKLGTLARTISVGTLILSRLSQCAGQPSD